MRLVVICRLYYTLNFTLDMFIVLTYTCGLGRHGGQKAVGRRQQGVSNKQNTGLLTSDSLLRGLLIADC